MGIFDGVAECVEELKKDKDSAAYQEYLKKVKNIYHLVMEKDSNEDSIALIRWIDENKSLPQCLQLCSLISDMLDQNEEITKQLIQSNNDIKKLHSAIDKLYDLEVLLVGGVTKVNGWYRVVIRDLITQEPKLIYKTRSKRHTTSKYIMKKFKIMVFMYNAYI